MYSIIPRVYDVDYSFIVKNYLNPELWDMKWTLFMYKDFIIYLELYSINCKDKEITFKLYYNDKKQQMCIHWSIYIITYKIVP